MNLIIVLVFLIFLLIALLVVTYQSSRMIDSLEKNLELLVRE